jgi:hypothetical protein
MVGRSCGASSALVTRWRTAMKHRCRSRIPGRLPIYLGDRDRWLGPFLTQDVTPGGLFPATGPLVLRRRQWIRLRLIRRRDGPLHRRRGGPPIGAGIGVMLVKRDPLYARALLRVPAVTAVRPPWLGALSREAGR